MHKHLWLCFASLYLVACATPSKKLDGSINNDDSPKLLRPDVKKIWVPAEIRDGGVEWVEGHYIYRVEKGALWSR